jgi:hypothetical protein
MEGIEPNRWFTTIADLAHYIAETRKTFPQKRGSYEH